MNPIKSSERASVLALTDITPNVLFDDTLLGPRLDLVAGESAALSDSVDDIRRPQYTGFFLFLLGSIINWPTIPTLVTLPILWWVYLRLAKAEERNAIDKFGDQYRRYMSETGRFVPGLGRVRVATI